MKTLLLSFFVLFSTASFADDLIKAVKANDLYTAQTLLEEGADPNEKSGIFLKKTALIIAIKNRSPDMVKLLLEFDADPNLAHGGAPLNTAIARGCLDCVKLLLEFKADTNKYFSLKPAIVTGCFDCVKWLIEARAYIHVHWDEDSKNYLTLAEKHRRWEIAEYLRELGITKPNVQKNKGGGTVIVPIPIDVF